jgi:DNA polymerase/3'-5' exonuclease PolX
MGANPFRVGAYRKAANVLVRLEAPVRALFDDKGREELETLPGIGRASQRLLRKCSSRGAAAAWA